MARRGQPGIYERTSARGTVSWQAVVDGPRNPDGSRRQIRKTFATQRAARDWRQKTLHELRAGVYVEPSRELVRDYAAHWLATRDVRPASYRAYEGALRLHILPAIGQLTIGAVTPRRITDLWTSKREHGARSHIIYITRSLFALAVREGLIARNPCEGAVTAARPRKPERVRIWDAATLRRFLTLTEGTSRHALWWTLAYTGLRVGEAMALRWSDVDLPARVVRVERTQTLDRAGQVVAGPPKTASSRREVTIDADTAAVLSRHRAAQNTVRLALGADWQDNDLVFPRADGGMARHGTAGRAFRDAARRLELPEIGVHGLRHAHVSLLLAAGVPVHYVSKRLGHATVEMTLSIYGHLVPGSEHTPAETFAAVMQAAK